MAFFGLGPKKENPNLKSRRTRPQSSEVSLTQPGKGKKATPTQQASMSVNSSSAVEDVPVHRNTYVPQARIPGDAAFLTPMGDVNQPVAVYQQHLARQWQQKAAERAEMRDSAAREEQMMLSAQSLPRNSALAEKQWPVMPLEFQIEHFDITNKRYHTMFLHLGISAPFFQTIVAVHNAACKLYQEDHKKKESQFRNQDWEAIGRQTASLANELTATYFHQLMRVDYKWNNFQRTGKYILTYPLRPEDVIPWCEAHKLPLLNDKGKAAWAEHRAKLERGEPTEG